MIEKKKIYGYINILQKAMKIALSNVDDMESFKVVVPTILDIQQKVNNELFFTGSFSAKAYSPNLAEEASNSGKDFLNGVQSWFEYVVETMQGADEKGNYLDSEFYCMSKYVSVSTKENLEQDLIYNFYSLDEKRRRVVMDYYNDMDYFWGAIKPELNCFDLIKDRVNVLKDREKDFLWLYDRLSDYRSKIVLYRILRSWICMEEDNLRFMKELSYPDYFDLDILKCSDEEVMVDCGAYIGDSAAGFIECFKKYKKIYCYEATASTFEELSGNLSGYENIVLKNLAVGEEYGELSLSIEADGKSSIYGEAQQIVPVVPIDKDIEEPISIIKMDIEGAEQSALRGARSHIVNDYPKLLICVYHGNHDIIEIPLMIEEMRDDYDFYLRYNGNLIVPTEIVFFCIPRKVYENN